MCYIFSKLRDTYRRLNNRFCIIWAVFVGTKDIVKNAIADVVWKVHEIRVHGFQNRFEKYKWLLLVKQRTNMLVHFKSFNETTITARSTMSSNVLEAMSSFFSDKFSGIQLSIGGPWSSLYSFHLRGILGFGVAISFSLVLHSSIHHTRIRKQGFWWYWQPSFRATKLPSTSRITTAVRGGLATVHKEPIQRKTSWDASAWILESPYNPKRYKYLQLSITA